MEYYTQELVDIIKLKYAVDFKLFGYSTELHP